jgi:hypothetical protein
MVEYNGTSTPSNTDVGMEQPLVLPNATKSNETGPNRLFPVPDLLRIPHTRKARPPDPGRSLAAPGQRHSSRRRIYKFLTSCSPPLRCSFCACLAPMPRRCDQSLCLDLVVLLPMRCRVCGQDSLADRPLSFRWLLCGCVVCRRDSQELVVRNLST